MKTFREFFAMLLCLALSPLPVFGEAAQRAGQVNAVRPDAMRNEKMVKVNDEVDWNDLLKTAAAGRLRANLSDGSILSLGSNSEMRVVQHDATSQQTSLEVNAGKLRSRVVKITQPNGKFEVRTPNAVIGVVGTDFYVEYANNKTTVICYSGVVSVSPQGAARVQKSSQGTSSTTNAVMVAAGQMVEIFGDIPPAGFVSYSTPPEAQQASIEGTTVTNAVPGVAVAGGHLLRNVLLGAIVAGASVGVIVGTRDAGLAKPRGNCQVDPKAC